ncbi:MAG TPA: Rne/Rng family ribonuclease [Micromonospora sp.]
MLDHEPEDGDRTGTEPVGDTAGTTASARRARAARRPMASGGPGADSGAEGGSPSDGDAAGMSAALATGPASDGHNDISRERDTAEAAVSTTAASSHRATAEPERSGPADKPVAPVAMHAPVTSTDPVGGASPTAGPATTPGAAGGSAPVRRVMTPPAVLFMAPDLEAAAEARRRAAASVPEPTGAALVDDADTVAVDTGAGEHVESGRRRRRRRAVEPVETAAEAAAGEIAAADATAAAGAAETADAAAGDEQSTESSGRRRRRRGRRGRGRGKGSVEEAPAAEHTEHGEQAEPAEDTAGHDRDEQAPRDEQGSPEEQATRPEQGEPSAESTSSEADQAEPAETAEAAAVNGEPTITRRRRRRRRRSGEASDTTVIEDGVPTVVKVREPRIVDEIQSVSGSTRLEAKRQRRRDGRDQRRTRPPILTESEFLARREAVDRVMVIRQRGDRTQIAVLEDGVLVEHYVARASQTTMAGNVYLGKVQNVLPSMEAAFVDVGRGRNAVLYAGEVNWEATGLEGRARSIEQALRSGDSVLVQVTKDPVGHKGARLTSHIALSGRHLVYVPNGNASGISRKLPENERKRLREILKRLVPDGAGVIVRTAAEGATEEELARDIKRLQAQWEDIQAKAATGTAPMLLYEEPDLVIRVVRDLFNEDFRELVIQGDEAYEMVESYLSHVSPDLLPRLRRHTGVTDVFAEHRIDEQILKALDRKVYLPSGGYIVIDRTEAMTVIDVNTGKYTGTGGNLEETVTRNNLEAAEEIVRQLRLRDLGGIIVVDFIDMVLESNRELVLRRLTECLGRDRTKHQVTEITSLGLVQMTRKRIGGGLLEAFSEPCECCKGRGVIIKLDPEPEKPKASAADKSKSVSSTGSSASARRRARKAAEPVTTDAAPQVTTDPALANGAASANGAAPASGASTAPTVTEPAGAGESGMVDYDPSRYGEPEKSSNGAVTPMRLAGPDDPDAALPGETAGAEPLEAGAGGRRRGGARRRA